MSASSPEPRMTELETRIAFQEQALSELNDALTQTRLEHARTHALLGRALDELTRMRGALLALDLAGEPPPPHY